MVMFSMSYMGDVVVVRVEVLCRGGDVLCLSGGFLCCGGGGAVVDFR